MYSAIVLSHIETSDSMVYVKNNLAFWLSLLINLCLLLVWALMRNDNQTIFLCRGGPWNSGGQCHKETEPIFKKAYLAKYPSKMRVLHHVLHNMTTPVIYMNISRLTDYRKDGHPSIYRKEYKTVEEQMAGVHSQDCSHWCLPGVPDTWNELLYASLLKSRKGSWKNWNWTGLFFLVILFVFFGTCQYKAGSDREVLVY